MEFNFLSNAAENMGASPYGLVIGFFGAAVSLLVINGNGFSPRKILFGISSAMVLCGFVFHGLIPHVANPAIRSVITLAAAVLAPDIFTFFKSNGKTITGRVVDLVGSLAKRWATGMLSAVSGVNLKDPPKADQATTDTDPLTDTDNTPINGNQ